VSPPVWLLCGSCATSATPVACKTVSRQGSKGHHPRLANRADGRFEVQCPQCWMQREGGRPMGIGVPIVNRAEAEMIVRNHSDRATSSSAS
jgi:hypothetical protein